MEDSQHIYVVRFKTKRNNYTFQYNWLTGMTDN